MKNKVSQTDFRDIPILRAYLQKSGCWVSDSHFAVLGSRASLLRAKHAQLTHAPPDSNKPSQNPVEAANTDLIPTTGHLILGNFKQSDGI